MCDCTQAVQVKSGMYIDSHLERCVLVQAAELCTPCKDVNWNLNFINGGPILAMENFSKLRWPSDKLKSIVVVKMPCKNIISVILN